MSKKFKVLKQITAIILCISLLSSQMTITYADETENSDMENGVDAYEQSYEEFSSESENSDPAETTGSTEVDSEIESSDSEVPDSFDGASEEINDISEDEETGDFESSEDQGFSDGEESKDNTEDVKEDVTDTLEETKSDYADGKICIYNYSQLLLVGTGTQMFTGDKDGNIGEGEAVLSDNTELTYAADASYYLMNDILMDMSNVWNFPEGFSGSILSAAERADNTIYNAETDTIYIYNRYQLALLGQEDSDKEPVMSEDYVAEKVAGYS